MKILIVGPIMGGSLPVARAAASACVNLGLDVRFLDYSPYADEYYRVKASANHDTIVAFLAGLETRLREEITKAAPEVLLGIAQAPLYNTELLDALRKAGVLTAFWFVEDYRVLTYWRHLAAHFHVFFTIQTGSFREQLRHMGVKRPAYLPLAFDGNLKEDPVQELCESDVSFMGAPYPNRVDLLGHLARFRLKIYGEGWNMFQVPGVTIGDRRIADSEARWIYRHTKVNINLHSSMDPLGICGDFVNPRTFEMGGLGCFQLTDRRDLLPLHYEVGREVVQFRSVAELIDKTSYFLKHDKERNEIAMNARRKTYERHLYEHRILEMLEVLRRI
jgi:spore maturation protein CgeB